MPSKPTLPNKIPLDPIFPIPLGAEELFTYTKENANSMGSDVEDIDDLTFVGDYILDDSVTDADSTALGVPDGLTIISQTVRRASGGALVVDVVVGIEEVPGAEDYDIQVVKV